jgi:myb proto-oncogene protein
MPYVVTRSSVDIVTWHCLNRWHDALDPSIDPATARAGNWTAEENEKLKDAVRAHGGKNWKEIAALVPGRTKQQYQSRLYYKLFFNIDPTTARTGKWTEDENKKLREAVGAHGAKNWEEIVALVPGRTQKNSVVRGGA